MPDQTKTIIAGGGGDYSTIQAWENDTDVSGGFWKGVISDNSAYDETVTISGGTGTPTASNYVWLDVDASNRHAGAAGTGHGRMNIDTASGHAITVGADFVRISNLEIKQASPGASDEGIRVNGGVDDLLIEKCIIWTDSATADTDGVYAGNSSVTLTAVNCLLYGWQRAGFHQQNFNSTTITSRWAIEHCSIYDCGVTGEASSGGIVCEADGTSTAITYVVNNTASLGNDAAGEDYAFVSGTTTKVAWTGSNNADSDGSLANRANEAADTIDTNSQTPLVATTVWTAPGTGDFTVVNSQGLDDNGASFTSDDTRADVSVDIAGTSRDGTTPDIGCFEEAGAGASITAESGSYTWTGTAANLEHHKVITASGGSYAWTGTDATLLKGTKITAEAGSYVWTGTAANLEHHKVLSAEAGSYAWTGQDATLTHVIQNTLTAESGSYVWTGTAANLLYSKTLTADAGSYTWTGTDAVLTKTFLLTAESGSYVWTGTAAGLLLDRLLQADAGIYLWTGQDAVLSIPGGLDITSTVQLQKPIDYIMADEPPFNPVLTDRPGRLTGPRLVNRVHLSQGPAMSPKPQPRLRGPRLVERKHIKT